MTQPTIKVLQISQEELASFVSTELASTPLDGLNNVVLSALTEGEVLTYSGSPLEWRNIPSAQGLSGGDGITVTAGSPTALIAVDSSVARRNATNTFQQANTFTATVSGINSAGVFLQSAVPGYILDETGAGVDESIWRMFASSGQLVYDVRNDANDTSVNWLTVQRSGTTIISIDFIGTAMTFNGGAIHAGSPVGGGGGGGGGSPIDPNAALMSAGSPFVSRPNVGQLQLESNDDATAPTIAFGSPAYTGFFESADDTIEVARAGVSEWLFTIDSTVSMFRSENSRGAGLRNVAASATNPTLHPARNDINSGIGARSNDEISLIVGGQEGLRLVETSNQVTQTWGANVSQTAVGSPSGIGDGQKKSSYNIFSTVSPTGVMTMPDQHPTGTILWVKNDGDNTLTIFPWTGDNFEGLAANEPKTLVAGGTALFFSTQTNVRWTEFINGVSNPTIGDLRGTTITGGAGSPSLPEIGDTLFYDGSNWVNLARGTAGQVLTMGSPLVPSWATAAGGSPVTTDLGSLTDVVLGSPLTNNLLFHNGTNWVDTAGVLTWDGSHLLLPQENDDATPTLAFGDGGSGFYMGANNQINVAVGGSTRYNFAGALFRTNNLSGAGLIDETATAVNPTLLPRNNDTNTGIGSASADDTLSLIAGSQEAMRFTEVSNDVLVAVSSNVGLTAAVVVGSPSSAQGEGVIASSHNVYSTVANAGDAATLPATFIVGTKVYVKNDGANLMDVFPASGDTITPSAVNIAESIQPGESVTFIATVANSTWTQLITGAQTILDIQTSVGGSPALGSPLGAYTLVLGDELDKWIRLTASSIIVPPNATTAFTIGSQVTIFNISGAAATISAGGSPIAVTVNGVSSVDNDAGVAFIKVATDEWDAV